MTVAPREKLARRAAQEVLREVGVAGLPVDPFDIVARKLPPIPLLEQELPAGIYGACGFLKGQFVIAVSTTCPTTGHRRFTAAHELGHYHMPDHVDRMFAGGREWAYSHGGHFQPGADPVEREADYFASELLMPESLVRPLIKGRPNFSQVSRIADRCGVSISSAAITMARLAPDPVAVLVSRDGILEWPAFSPAFHEYPWARARVKGEWAPKHSRTRRLAQNPDAIRRGDALVGEGLLCEWFQGAPDWVKVFEDAVGLGSYGRILTVLVPGPLPDPDQEQERSWRRQREEWADEEP